MTVDTLPSLDPTSPTFRPDVDSFFAQKLPTFSTQINSLRTEVVDAAGTTAIASAAAVQAKDLAVPAAAAAVAANAAAQAVKPVTSPTPPSSPGENARWIHSDTGREYTYLATANGFRWVETAASVVYQSPISAEDQGFNLGATGSAERTTRDKLRETVSISDFAGADPTGVADSLAAFNAAAATGNTVRVTKGIWKLSAPTTGNTMWLLDDGAYITGLTDINPGPGGGIINDTRRLTGKMFHMVNSPGYTGIRMGDTDPWLERDIRAYSESISEVAILSSSGQIALVTGTRSSDDLNANFAAIGHSSFAINDNTTSPEPAWATYREYRRMAGAGATYGMEMDAVNSGNTFDLDPYTAVSTVTTQTVHQWLTNGGGDGALAGNEVSAALATHANPQKFRRGFVFRHGSLNTTLNEMIAGYSGARHAWYDAAGSLISFISDRVVSMKSKSNTGGSGVSYSSYRRKADGVTATANLDVVHRHDFFGYSGSADYTAAWQQVQQRANFGSGNARFSYDIGARNGADGSESQISLNGLANKSYAPFPDNSIALGDASFRWSVVYAATGTINTSDETQKQDIVGIDDALIDAFLSVEPVTYRWKDAVAGKGDAARIHAGWIAQHLQAALIAQGCDPGRYAIWCEDEVYAPVPGWNGEGVPDVQPTGEKRQALRYDQFIALMEAANRRRFEQIESRLRALEAAVRTGGK